MKKGISVQTILCIALAVMFIIAAALIIGLLFPYATQGECIKGQRLHIEEIESYSRDAITTGTTYTLKFKVEDCVDCFWYYDNTAINQDQLKIRWVGMSTTDDPVIMNVSVPWHIGTNSGGDDKTCSSQSDENLKGGTTWVLEIKYNGVDILPT